MDWLKQADDGVILNVRVVPRGSRNQVVGVLGDALKIRLQAPPVEGKANKALSTFLAQALDVPRSCVSIVSGQTSRTKKVLVKGVTTDRLLAVLHPAQF